MLLSFLFHLGGLIVTEQNNQTFRILDEMLDRLTRA